MSARKKGGKRSQKRISPTTAMPTKKERLPKPSIAQNAPMKKRIKEKNDGFGVLKGVALAILMLIVVSTILFNRAGGRDAMRGDKGTGELCEKTVECAKGSICYSYKDNRSQCLRTCSKKRPCDSEHTCITAASQKRKRGIRLADICVKNEDL